MQVSIDFAEQQALGFGHELVSGSDDDVRRLTGEQSEGHCGNRLHATQREDHVGAGDLHRIEDLRMNALAAIRRRAGDDKRNARGLRAFSSGARDDLPDHEKGREQHEAVDHRPQPFLPGGSHDFTPA